MTNNEEDGEQFNVCFTFSLVKEDGTPAAGTKMIARYSAAFDRVVETADEHGDITFDLYGVKGSPWSRFQDGRHEIRVLIVFGERYDVINENEYWFGDGDGCTMTVVDECL